MKRQVPAHEVVTCDRCEFEVTTLERTHGAFTAVEMGGVTRTADFDLCAKCAAGFTDFMLGDRPRVLKKESTP